MSLNYLTEGKEAKFISAHVGQWTVDTSTVTDLSLGTTLKLVDTVIYDKNDNELLTHTATAAAVNHIELVNAASGTEPGIKAAGDDADIGLDLVPKGTGELGLFRPKLEAPLNMNGQDLVDAAGDELLSLASSALPVNYAVISSSDTGAGVSISTAGADVDIPLKLNAKGVANIDCSSKRLINILDSVDPQDAVSQAEITAAAYMQNLSDDTTPQLGGDLDLNGNLELRNGADEVLAFVAPALSVNHLQISSNATGSMPGIGSVGDDATVGFSIGTQGGAPVAFQADIAMGANRFVDASGGELLDLLAAPLAVNQMSISSAATGSGPVLSVAGDDVNVDLVLQAQAAGVISCASVLSLSAAMDAGSNLLNNVADPVAGTDAANNQWVLANSINAVSEDATPQLGADLDAQALFNITNLLGSAISSSAATVGQMEISRELSVMSCDGQAGTAAVAAAVTTAGIEKGTSITFSAVNDDFLINATGTYEVMFTCELTGTANDDVTLSLGTGDGSTAIAGTTTRHTIQATGDFITVSKQVILDLTATNQVELLFTGAATTTLGANSSVQIRRIL